MQLLLSQALQVPGVTRLSPTDLRGHMEERFARALSQGHAVSVLACETSGLEQIERQDPGLTPSVLLGSLALALEPAFHAAEAVVDCEGRNLIVFLIGPAPDRIPAACRAWIEGAKKLRIDGRNGTPGLSLIIGYGIAQPGKRLFLDTLIQVARESLRVARCRGAGACVHTMLYDILQDRLEQERGTKGTVVSASTPLDPGAPAREAPVHGAQPAIAEVRPQFASPPPQQRLSVGEPAARPRPEDKGPPPARLQPTPGLTETERLQRELIEALNAQRRENDALRTRLRELETPDDLSGAVSARAAPAEDPQDKQRIETLERRLAKLMLSLEEAEQRLSRVSRMGDADSGIASCYRTVQGLDTDAPQRTLKAALMLRIFQANLDLRERFLALRPGAPRNGDGAGIRSEGNGSDGLVAL